MAKALSFRRGDRDDCEDFKGRSSRSDLQRRQHVSTAGKLHLNEMLFGYLWLDHGAL